MSKVRSNAEPKVGKVIAIYPYAAIGNGYPAAHVHVQSWVRVFVTVTYRIIDFFTFSSFVSMVLLTNPSSTVADISFPILISTDSEY